MEEKAVKLIFSPGIARNLLKRNCTICDIKQSREDPRATVFAFVKDNNFDVAMEEITKSIKEKKVKDVE